MISFFQSAALLPVEHTLNQVLAADPFSQRRLAKFSGKVLHIECQLPALDIFVLILPRGLRLSATCDQAVDGKISSTASNLLTLLLNKQDALPLANPTLQVSGDALLVQEVYEIFAELNVNWQDPLSLVIGDVATWQLESSVKNFAAWSGEAAASVVANLDEYMHEEARLIPSQAELDAHTSRLESLKLRIDRLQARKSLLQDRYAGR